MIPSPAPLDQRLLEEWQQLTRQGLQASQAHGFVQALALHQRALPLARQLLAACAHDNALAAFAVTHLNLADAYVDTGQPAAAAACLADAHRSLQELLGDETLPAALGQAICHHLGRLQAARLQHLAAHGASPPAPQASAAAGAPPCASHITVH